LAGLSIDVLDERVESMRAKRSGTREAFELEPLADAEPEETKTAFTPLSSTGAPPSAPRENEHTTRRASAVTKASSARDTCRSSGRASDRKTGGSDQLGRAARLRRRDGRPVASAISTWPAALRAGFGRTRADRARERDADKRQREVAPAEADSKRGPHRTAALKAVHLGISVGLLDPRGQLSSSREAALDAESGGGETSRTPLVTSPATSTIDACVVGFETTRRSSRRDRSFLDAHAARSHGGRCAAKPTDRKGLPRIERHRVVSSGHPARARACAAGLPAMFLCVDR